MSRCTVDRCDQDTRDDAFVCDRCAATTDSALAGVPDLVADLHVSVARQGRIGDQGGGRGTHRALPFGWAAADALWGLTHTLSRLAADHGAPNATTVADAAAWLRRRLSRITHQPDAADTLDLIADTIDHARHTIDRPPDRQYAGPCDDCGADLYARADADTVRCPCGAAYPMHARRAWLLDAARDTLATAVEISRALGDWRDVTLPVDTIRSWHHRGRLTARGYTTDTRPRPLFRVGDVDALLTSADRPTRRHPRAR